MDILVLKELLDSQGAPRYALGVSNARAPLRISSSLLESPKDFLDSQGNPRYALGISLGTSDVFLMGLPKVLQGSGKVSLWNKRVLIRIID